MKRSVRYLLCSATLAAACLMTSCLEGGGEPVGSGVDTYAITVIAGNGGTAEAGFDGGGLNTTSRAVRQSADVDEDTVIILTAVPQPGYVFKHWTVTDVNGILSTGPKAINPTQFTMPAVDIIAEAVFEAAQ